MSLWNMKKCFNLIKLMLNILNNSDDHYAKHPMGTTVCKANFDLNFMHDFWLSVNIKNKIIPLESDYSGALLPLL